jgi:hypothetical protein
MSYRHSPTARAVLRSLVPVICPPEAHGLADAIVDHMALTIDVSPPLLQKGLAAGFVAYDVGALPRYFKRAQHLAPDRADRYYDSWDHGFTPFHRQFARGIKQLMSLSCYEMPEMTERLGYRPAPWITEVTQKRLTVFRDDVRAQERQILAPDPLRPGVRVDARRKGRL